MFFPISLICEVYRFPRMEYIKVKHLTPNINFLSIHLKNPVSSLHSFYLCRISWCHTGNHRFIIANPRNQYYRKNKCQYKIKNRSGCNNRNSCPDRLCVKTSLGHILHIIFAHHTGASDWKQFDRIPCISGYFAEQAGTHSDRKLLHMDSILFRQQKMSQFMDCHNQSEHQYCKYNSHFTTCFLSVHILLVPSVKSHLLMDLLSFCVPAYNAR